MRFLREQLTVDDILFDRRQYKKGDRVSVHYKTFSGEDYHVTGTVVKNNSDTVLVREDGTQTIHRYDLNQVNPERVTEDPNLDTEETYFSFLEDFENFVNGKPSQYKYPDIDKEFEFDPTEVYDMFDIGYGTSDTWSGFPDDRQIYKAYLREYFTRFCKLNGLPDNNSLYKYCISRDFDTMFEDQLDNSIPTEEDLRDWAKSYSNTSWL